MKDLWLLTILFLLSAGNVVRVLEAEEFATFIFENDLFTDDGYSNGMGYTWGRTGFDELDDSNTPGWIQWLSEDLYISAIPTKCRAIIILGDN